MKTTLWKLLAVVGVLATGAVLSVHGIIPDDADGDGVPDSVDVCPGEDASGFDRNGDGCIDAFIGARHVEYWGTGDTTITYVINDIAAPAIVNGSDITAVQSAIAAWSDLPDTELDVVYGGTTPQQNADGLDGIHLVTFLDNDYPFSNLVLAVGLTTSFEADTLIDGRVYRTGEIFDADMLFNPSRTFTTGAGPGTDIQSVATHEAGHLFGLSHSSIKSSTMFYVLPGGTAARSLETDDELAYFKAYGDAGELANASRIDVTVTHGQTSDPVAGVIVFVIDAASEDTVGCDYTLPDGTATFPGLEDGDYYVSIHALDGSSAIGFIEPGNINALVASFPNAPLVAESWDASESNTDNSNDRDEISVANGSVEAIGIVTNIDATAPVVVKAVPVDNTAGVGVDAAYVVEFSEPVELGTIQPAFSFRKDADSSARAGNIAVLRDQTKIVFTPSPPLEFGEAYTLRFDTDLTDRFGNALAADFTLGVTTENEPPLSISSLNPSKGVIGNTIVISGQGFAVSPAPTVHFGTDIATVESVAFGRIVVTVPNGATTGPVTVTNFDNAVSNTLTFTVLTQAEVARGYDSGQVTFDSEPAAIAVVPSGARTYVASGNGVESVNTDPSSLDYLTSTQMLYGGGLTGIASAPSGRRVYGISASTREMVEIDSDPDDGLLFNTILSSHDVGDTPLAIVVEPAGRRAYIATDGAEIIAWDITLGSVSYQQEVNVLPAPGGVGLRGTLAVTPAGDRLLALADDGTLLFFALPEETLSAQIAVGAGARDVIVDPQGERAYVSHDTGDISVINLQGAPFQVQDIATGGSLRGGAISPGGSYLYVSDRDLDNLKIVDLIVSNGTFRSVVEDITAPSNPVDVVIAPDGLFAYSILQGAEGGGDEPRLLVTTIGLGPQVRSIYPTAARPNDIVVLGGSNFGDPQDLEVAAVEFNGMPATMVSQSPDQIAVRVPAGATTGPVRVELTKVFQDSTVEVSNAVPFRVLTEPSLDGGMHYYGSVGVGVLTTTLEPVLAMNPKGDVLFVADNTGIVFAVDIRPGSVKFQREIARFKPFETDIEDMAVTADGKTLFVVASQPTSNPVPAIVADLNDPLFGKNRALVTPPSPNGFSDNLTLVRTSPNNRYVLIADFTYNVVHIVDATGVSEGSTPTVIGDIGTSPGIAADIAFHPSGRMGYIAIASPEMILTVDLDDTGIEFGLVEQVTDMPGVAPLQTPFCLVPLRDGSALQVLTKQIVGPSARTLVTYPLSANMFLASPSLVALESSTSFQYVEQFRVSPLGDVGVRVTSGNGVVQYPFSDPNDNNFGDFGGDVQSSLAPNEFEFTPDGSRVYFADTVFDSVRVYTFAEAFAMFVSSGNNQNGVVNQELAAPIRIQFAGGGFVTGGLPATFRVTSGGGVLLVGDVPVPEVIVSADDEGFAEARWRLGSGTGPQTVQVSALGVSLSPQTFTATAFTNPETLPLSIGEVLPLAGANTVSPTTAVLATFSRAVNPASIGSTSLFVQVDADATLIPVAYGFTDGNRKVSLTPLSPLPYNTEIDVVYTDGIQDGSGGSLTNPGEGTFRTRLQAAPAIRSISPPSALAGVQVMIAGTDFDPVAGNNAVSFNGTPATPVSGGFDYLLVRVPVPAITGPVTVTRGGQTSNAQTFTVLHQTTVPIDDVIVTVGTGSSARSVAVTPDGALCYTVSTDGDVVVPVDVETALSLEPIQVGDQPVAIAIHPDGTFAYVANFNSGTVSVIDIVVASPTFNTVVATLTVGVNPIDVVVLPDGDRVVVANATSNDLSIIDGNAASASHNQVIMTVGTGSSAKSVAVTPDGTRIYIGTDTGYIVMDTSSYGVLTTVGTGSSAKSVAITPDGSLLLILTTSGTLQIVDIVPGSQSENQVITTIGTGSSAKSVAVSPDGSLLYIIQEDSDLVIVVALEIIGGVSALDPTAAAPGFQIVASVVDSVLTGAGPSDVVIDPSGTGRVFVANAGDKTLTILNGSDIPQGPLMAEIEVTPRTLNLQSNGKYVTGCVELPAAFAPQEIVLSSVRLQGVIPPVEGLETFEDDDEDGIQELCMRFDRAAFQAVLPQGEEVPVTITGDVRNRTFAGEDTIRTLRPTVTHPHGGVHVAPGVATTIVWTSPAGHPTPTANVDVSVDDGLTWTAVAHGVPNTGTLAWTPPLGFFDACRVMVTLFTGDGEILGQGMNQDAFVITAPLTARLKAFDISVEDGAAVLRWETGVEIGTDGFRVVRAQSETGAYAEVTQEMIQAGGSAEGSRYEWRDEALFANRTYWYKVREVTADGLGVEFGPYAVTYRLAYGLEQNSPNPFNPSTTIAYSLAKDGDVSLVVYDVAGRQVRTLVNQRQKADAHRIPWDGRNDAGEQVASGMYFYKLVSGKFTATKKMMLLK